MKLSFYNRILNKIKRVIGLSSQKLRILCYNLLSTCCNIEGSPTRIQALQLNGLGKIIFRGSVVFGVYESKGYFTGYGLIDVRDARSQISIGNETFINNNCTIISDGAGIEIGENCLIGYDFEALDSDFHELNPLNRFGGKNITRKKVKIDDNVFIGNRVSILKGVTIGKNSVIGNGSVVTKDIPPNSIAAGNPAKVIRNL